MIHLQKFSFEKFLLTLNKNDFFIFIVNSINCCFQELNRFQREIKLRIKDELYTITNYNNDYLIEILKEQVEKKETKHGIVNCKKLPLLR